MQKQNALHNIYITLVICALFPPLILVICALFPLCDPRPYWADRHSYKDYSTKTILTIRRILRKVVRLLIFSTFDKVG